MDLDAKILVLGAGGLVGSAIVRQLRRENYENILTPTHSELDCLQQSEVLDYFARQKPQIVFLAAARVGGIYANNTYRADFLIENLTIEVNVFQAAHQFEVGKLLFLGSSCIYPKNSPCPIKEESLLNGPLESTNEPYAIAKIAGLKLAENYRRQYNCYFIAAQPTNIYGINDNFHKENSHVIPGLIARMSDAKKSGEDKFEVWGSGEAMREFLFCDDLARACLLLMQTEKELPYFLNIGTGEDLKIRDLVEIIAKELNFNGKIIFNRDYPDGMMRKCLDVSKIKALGWRPQTSLTEGIKLVVAWYLDSRNFT